MNRSQAPNNQKSKKKNPLGTVLFVLFNVIVIGYTAYVEFSKERPESFALDIGATNIICLVIGVLCPLAVLLSDALKYLVMMRALGEKVSFRHAFQVSALGKYYDAITPSGAGGQPFQIWYLGTNGYTAGTSAAMPLTAFITMQFGFVIVALVAFIFNGAVITSTALKITAYIGLIAYMIVPVSISVFAVAPKTAGRMMRFFVKLGAALHLVKDPFKAELRMMRSLNDYCRNTKAMFKDKVLLLKLMVLSVIHHFVLCSIPYFVIKFFGGDLPYFEVFSVCAFIYAAISIVPTPGNSGAAEGSFYALFEPLGANCLFWAMLVWRFICYYIFIIIGVLVYGYNAIAGKRIERSKNNGRSQ